MKPDDKQRLVDSLMGTTRPLTVVMTSLGITEGINITREELSDTIAPCVTCSKWTDIAVIDNGHCSRCDLLLNPSNQEKSE